jgi:rhamnosyltransferase
MFESSGPGCTFVFPRRRFEELKSWVSARHRELEGIKVHDWLIYAYAREHGWSWHIDHFAGLRYRQHDKNEVGANMGRKAFWSRIRRVRSGLFRADVLAIADAVGADNEATTRLRRLAPADRLWLTLHAGELRRRWRDQMMLRALLLLMPTGAGVRHIAISDRL